MFNAIIHKEDGGYSAEVPALPGCYTDGETLDEIRVNLREAIRLYLEVAQGETGALPAGSQLIQVAM